VVPIPKVFPVRPKATRTAFCLKIAESTEAWIEAGGASNADPLKALVDDMRKAIGAAREIRTPDPIITNNLVLRDTARQSVSGPDKIIDGIGA
jgi:hypothetical protein